MDNSRNRIEKFVNYIESQGIVINLTKNKARGNKGLFKVFGSNFRIDISKDINESEILHVLVHEFTHYVHYKYDKSLKSLNFLLGDKEEEYLEDLIQLTVDSIPKTSIEPLFNEKEKINREIKLLSNSIKSEFPNFKISQSDKDFEKKLKFSNIKYLLKHDNVKLFKNFSFKIYRINNIDNDFSTIDENLRNYVKLKSKQRCLKRINSRINKLNKYYNSSTELLARTMECYFLTPVKMQKLTPVLYEKMENSIVNLEEFRAMKEILL